MIEGKKRGEGVRGRGEVRKEDGEGYINYRLSFEMGIGQCCRFTHLSGWVKRRFEYSEPHGIEKPLKWLRGILLIWVFFAHV